MVNQFGGQTRTSFFSNEGQNQVRETLFQLPVDPEQFGVLLPPADLRRLDFSALEFTTARRALIEYIRTYFPDDFNDFVANNGIIMLVELLSYITAVLSLRADVLANEAFLPTANTENAVVNHLALISQKIRRASPAVTDIELSIPNRLGSDVRVPPGLSFQISGGDGDNITYEVFRSPDDFTSDIIIPAGKRGIIAFGIEGRTKSQTSISEGISDQRISILDDSILESPVRVTVSGAGSSNQWDRIEFIEQANPTDEVFEARFFEGELQIVFGNNVTGAIPENGATIEVEYRTGGGRRGRIGAGVIDETRPITPEFPFTATIDVRFRNISGSSGGDDQESIDEAKRRAPRDFATRNVAVAAEDYAQLVNSFSHPTFGSVSKSLATIRTGLNSNRVELHILAEGTDGAITTPSVGLKKAVDTFITDLNVLTDHVVVLDAIIKNVDLEMQVIINRRADPTVVKQAVNDAIDNFFDINNFDLGDPFYVSRLCDAIQSVDGVSYVDIIKPSDNILPVDRLGEQRVLNVEVQTKTVTHPEFGNGDNAGYKINGIEGKELNLEIGVEYTFNVDADGQPFYLTTSNVGQDPDAIITDGVESSTDGYPTDSGSFTFTPSESTPSAFWYQSLAGNSLGWKINVVQQGIGRNEIIRLGDRQLKFFFERRPT